MSHIVCQTTHAGDQTGHLLWRLMHGEVPNRRVPKAAILLIGTNDLGRARRQRNDPADAAPDAVRRCAAARVDILGAIQQHGMCNPAEWHHSRWCPQGPYTVLLSETALVLTVTVHLSPG
jgi:hypothetical protein